MGHFHSLSEYKLLDRSRSELAKHLYITVGDEPDFRKGIQDFVNILKKRAPKNLRWEFVDMEKERHGMTPHLSIYHGLETVFSDWSLPADVFSKGLEAIKKYYVDLSEKYGLEIHAQAAILNFLGYNLIQEKKFEDSIKVFNHCISIYPDFWLAYHNLAYCYQQTGNKDLAIKNYEKTLQLNPDNSKAVERLKKLKSTE